MSVHRCQECYTDIQLLQEVWLQDGCDGSIIPQCWTDYCIGRLWPAHNKVHFIIWSWLINLLWSFLMPSTTPFIFNFALLQYLLFITGKGKLGNTSVIQPSHTAVCCIQFLCLMTSDRLTLLIGLDNILGIQPVKSSVSKPLGMADNVSGQDTNQSSMFVQRVSACSVRMLRIRMRRQRKRGWLSHVDLKNGR